MNPHAPSRSIETLLAIMAALRTPETGCAWDLAQDFASIAPYTIEEAYEVADAVARGDLEDLCDELGDLLLQVAFHARMAEERGAFDFGDVVLAITEKLIRRHPHVFGAARDLPPEQVKRLWDEIKRQEKAARAARRGAIPTGLLADVPVALPALTRALKLQTKAATVGFDWNDPRAVLDKIHEEAREIVEAQMEGADPDKVEDEVGDLLFVCVNLARHLKVDPEKALTRANGKFLRRFAAVEAGVAADGDVLSETPLDRLEEHWRAAKRAERADFRSSLTRASPDGA